MKLEKGLNILSRAMTIKIFVLLAENIEKYRNKIISISITSLIFVVLGNYTPGHNERI